MPINAGVEFAKAQEEYLKAVTTEEKILALKKMLASAPKHKGAEKLLNQLKQRLASLKKELEKEKSTKKKKTLTIKKEGAARVVFIGVLDSGKSAIFAKLTNTKYESENNYDINMKMIPFQGIWLQGIDLPAFHANFLSSPKAGQIFSLIRTADVILMIANDEQEIQFLQSALEKAKIKIGQKKVQTHEKTEIPAIVISFPYNEDFEALKEKLWAKTGKIRVQTRAGGKVAEKPIVLKQGATVKDLAEIIHKDFIKNFKYAKIWGTSAKFPGQTVGKEHELKDKDIVEIFTK
jgi:ribosome-interacting GTPase 1